MRKTKLVALLLAVALIASMVVPGVAAEDVYTISVVDYTTKADAITADAGTKILVQLQLSGNPGISSLAAELTYPEGWTITMVQEENLFASANPTPTTSQYLTENPYYVHWLMAYGTTPSFADPGGKLSFENGALYSLQIEIPADEMSGDYELTLNTTGRVTNYNYALDTDADGRVLPGDAKTVLTVATKGMTVTVNGNEPAGTACPEHTTVTTWTDVAEGTWTGGAIAAGHYKLTGNQTPTTALTVAGDVCIDLNGYNITGPDIDNKRVFEIAATGALTVTDTAEEAEGVISGGRVRNTQTGSPVSEVWGGNIYNEGTFNLYGGVISGGYAYTSSNYYPHISGGNIYSAEGSVINVYGGTIKDGKVYKSGSYSTSNGLGGGNIYSKGTVNISGGTISNGVVEKIGQVSHTNSRGNYIYGGNIRMNGGVLNISGGEILGGKLTGVAKNATGAMTAYVRGGSIYAASCDVNISGGTISGGSIDVEVVGTKGATTATTGYLQGGNICVYGGTLDITGGTITGGTITGNVTDNVAGSGATLNNAIYGGNIAILGEATATMTDGTVTLGSITKTAGTNDVYGGNVSISDATFTMTGGTLSEGYAMYRGGNLSVHSGGTATVGGNAIVKDGKTEPMSTGARGTEACATTAGTTLIIEGNAQFINKDATDSLSTVYAITNANIVVNGGRVQGELCAAGTDANKKGSLTVNGGEFDVITQSSVITNVTIGNGVTFKEASWKYITGEALVLSGETAKYTTFATVTDALTAAKSGDTVLLLKDATATTVEVAAGVTLDLNGKNLTADTVTAGFAGSHVVDNVGTGKLVIDDLTGSSIHVDNDQLPIAVDGGYVFETIEFKQKQEAVDANTVTYKFYINSEAAKTMLDDAIKNGDAVTIQVYVTWNDGGVPKYKTFALNAADLLAYGTNWDTKMVVLTITGVAGITDLVCTGQVVANGVTVSA